jgi:hypothetical protein
LAIAIALSAAGGSGAQPPVPATTISAVGARPVTAKSFDCDIGKGFLALPRPT